MYIVCFLVHVLFYVIPVYITCWPATQIIWAPVLVGARGEGPLRRRYSRHSIHLSQGQSGCGS